MSPLLKHNSIFIKKDKGLTDVEIEAFYNLMKEHKDWSAVVEMKFDKLEERS